ncbi:unnamed protein product [Gongylonema pulchrum]|uniref:6-phosphogluconolactonase n=1 Tax=Gongylonema pulchrum TaxID=637853 RepID=A0A183D7Z7_9BILA|nr:unnamed protein product [Gongylonema pulchrum]
MEEGWPVFDLILLGVGPDGHTCSLFPGHSLLKVSESNLSQLKFSFFSRMLCFSLRNVHFGTQSKFQEDTKWVAAIEDSPKPPPQRITLTLPVLNHARNIAFISTDPNKCELIKTIFAEQDTNLPAAMVKPKSGNLAWFVDEKTFYGISNQ